MRCTVVVPDNGAAPLIRCEAEGFAPRVLTVEDALAMRDSHMDAVGSDAYDALNDALWQARMRPRV